MRGQQQNVYSFDTPKTAHTTNQQQAIAKVSTLTKALTIKKNI